MSNDGLSFDVIPAGAQWSRAPDEGTLLVARESFAAFRSAYEFVVIVAPSKDSLALACGLIEKPVAVLCAELGLTALAQLSADASRVRGSGAALHGLAIWAAELPPLALRSELTAETKTSRARRPIPEGP